MPVFTQYPESAVVEGEGGVPFATERGGEGYIYGGSLELPNRCTTGRGLAIIILYFTHTCVYHQTCYVNVIGVRSTLGMVKKKKGPRVSERKGEFMHPGDWSIYGERYSSRRIRKRQRI